MSSKITNELSVLELLRLLNEKLGLERTRLREIRVSPAISVTSLELEVSTSTSADHNKGLSRYHRSRVSKREYTMS